MRRNFVTLFIMKVLLQRVKNARVTVADMVISEVGEGILAFLGITHGDTESQIDFLIDKIINLRIFQDEQGKLNLSLIETKREILIVSQFTLYADCKKGRRPSFTDAAEPAFAQELYKKFVQKMRVTGITVGEGEFGADMDVSLTNWGPVTIMLEN